MKINHNISAQLANVNLKKNDNRLSLSMQKLSSGYKITKAADDSAGLAISNKMRTQIRALDRSAQNGQVVSNTIGIEKEVLNVDDVIETANHFRCIDMIIDYAKATLTENFIKKLHLVLKNGTSDSRKDWFVVGDYKKMPNEVGGMETALPEEVADRMKKLLSEYNNQEEKALEDILNFHVKFECIHPFQDGNGRVGRLIMFKECLKYNIVPFIIEDNLKMFYYRGLKEWNNEKGYLTDTCLTAQDRYKAYLDYFRIAY